MYPGHGRLLASIVAIGITISVATVGQDERGTKPSFTLSAEQVSVKTAARSGIVFTAESVSHALQQPVPKSWNPAVSKKRLRGATQYVEVAPAVVVVRTRLGHGTGFFIRVDGTLITNNHVIANGLWHDASGSYAMIHTGTLGPDGVMQLDPNPVSAHVLKHNATKDLAILRLDRARSGLPFLKFADTTSRPGLQIFIVGHPSSGMLWTYRSGEISSIGYSPKDMVNVIMPILAASEAQQQSAKQFLSLAGSEKIMLTSAVANPGDSGGPVVNVDGKVVAITFAVPSTLGEKAFSYHIHVDEVRDFVRNVPTHGTYVVPDLWDIGPQIKLLDLDNDGKPDVLVSGTTNAEEIMFDLGNQTPASLTDEAHLGDLIERRAWHCDFGFRYTDGTAFYDRDGDGQIDLIVLPSDAEPSLSQSRFVLTDGRWKYETMTGRLVDPSYLTGPSRAQRLAALLAAMSK